MLKKILTTLDENNVIIDETIDEDEVLFENVKTIDPQHLTPKDGISDSLQLCDLSLGEVLVEDSLDIDSVNFDGKLAIYLKYNGQVFLVIKSTNISDDTRRESHYHRRDI